MNPGKLLLALFLGLSFYGCSFGQSILREHKFDYDSIVCGNILSERTEILILMKNDSSNYSAQSFLGTLRNLEQLGVVDDEKIQIYEVSVETVDGICSAPRLNFRGFELASRKILDPHYIVVDTAGIAPELLGRLVIDSDNGYPMVYDKDDRPTSLILLPSEEAFFRIVLNIPEAGESRQIPNKRQLALSVLPSFLSVFKEGAQSRIEIPSQARIFSTRLSFSSLIGKSRHIGYSLGIGWINIRQTFEMNTGSNTLSDTLASTYDQWGTPYQRISYANEISETAKIGLLGIDAGLNFTIPFGEKAYLSLNPGFRFSSVVSSKYQATDGTISFGGLYPQYDVADTMFSGQYDFYQDAPIDSKSRHLDVKDVAVSGFLSIDFGYSPFPNKRLFFTCGPHLEVGSNLLRPKSEIGDRSKLAANLGDYNSLLYRSESLRVSLWGVRLGIAYKL